MHLGYLRYTSLKMTLPFGTFFRTCICGAASPQIGRLLQQIGRLPKMWKASKFRIFRRSGTAAHIRICIIVHTYVRRFMWCITAALSKFVKQRIVSLKERGLTNREVVAILKREGDMVHVTTQIVRRCHKRYVEAGSIICEATRIRKANSAHCCPSSDN